MTSFSEQVLAGLQEGISVPHMEGAARASPRKQDTLEDLVQFPTKLVVWEGQSKSKPRSAPTLGPELVFPFTFEHVVFSPAFKFVHMRKWFKSGLLRVDIKW